MRRDYAEELARSEARADFRAQVFDELEALVDLPGLSGDAAQATLQAVRERFEARFPVEDEEDE